MEGDIFRSMGRLFQIWGAAYVKLRDPYAPGSVAGTPGLRTESGSIPPDWMYITCARGYSVAFFLVPKRVRVFTPLFGH